MLHRILTTILEKEFASVIKKGSFDRLLSAFQVRFNLHTEYDKEEGYRHVTLLLYAPMNYVAVLAKEDWNVAPVSPDEDEDANLDYIKGDTGWQILSYHDTCWDEAISSFISKNEHRIASIDTLSVKNGWYEVVSVQGQVRDTISDLINEYIKNGPKPYVEGKKMGDLK